MPYEHVGSAPRRVAVIGGGISGMGAAHMLADTNTVVLFEANTRLGGHARTKTAGKRGDQAVDTGFIVFNYVNYPHLTALFDKLDVPVTKSDMSFAASIDGGWLEYSLRNTDALFAQRRNILRPGFIGMLRDVLKFFKHAEAAAQDPDLTIGDMMDNLGLGRWFCDYYLTPFTGAIWSTPCEKALDFPAQALVQFFRNHGLLSTDGQHQWYTVHGGSIEYVRRLTTKMESQGVDLRIGTAIQSVRRTSIGVEVKAWGSEWELFDDVVFATHSDQALALLSDASSEEHNALDAVKYQPNDVVLHSDTRLMPQRRKCWSSWNYTELKGQKNDRIDLTYWMNCLQPIPQDDLMFVTLNNTSNIREDLIYDQTVLHHPVYDGAALQAQKEITAMNGTNNTWFCGAWMKNGFHEDGLSSAVDVANGILDAQTGRIAAK